MSGVVQTFSSANTSRPQVPALFRKVTFVPRTVNLDVGGGRYDYATEYLADKGVLNIVFDTYNRSTQHNMEVADYVEKNKVDTVTCCNVLNVIDTLDSRLNVIAQCAKSLKPDGVAYFSVYEGDKSGVGRQTSADSWQNNRVTKDYVSEIKTCFGSVSVKNKVIVAKLPAMRKSVWYMDENTSKIIGVMQSRFDRNIANKNVLIVSSQSGAVREDNNVVDVIKGGTDKSVGLTTGVVISQNGTDYLQMIRKNALYLIPLSDVQLADSDVANYAYIASEYLKQILENQKEIAYQISICALFLKKLEPTHDVGAYRSKLLAYFNRFEERNETVRMYADNIVESKIAQLDNALSYSNIGVAVSAGLLILVSCAVSLSFASLAWYAYYKEVDSSRTDARDIIKLNKLLASLDSDVRDEVYRIINQYGDANYQAGVRKIKMQNLFGGIKNILIFGGVGLVAYYLFMNKNKEVAYDTDR